MSDIYICTIDKNDECDWQPIDEDMLDLSSHDAKVREEAFELVKKTFCNGRTILADVNYFDNWVDENS